MFKTLARRAAIAGTAAAAMVGAGLPAAATTAPTTVNPDGTTTVDVLVYSDFHGHLSDGAEPLLCAATALREENPDTLLVSNGDSIGGSAFESAVQQDTPTLEFQSDWLQPNASSLGNHEFDRGFEDLATRVVPSVSYPYISANLSGSNSGINAADVFEPYYMYEAGGFQIAVVGTTTQETPALVSPSGVEGLTFGDVYESTNAAAADAVAAGADAVLALTHYGNAAIEGGRFSDDIDAVLTGHTHANYVGTTTTVAGREIPMVEPGDYGTGLGNVEITFAADGTATFGAPQVIDTAGYMVDVTDDAGTVTGSACGGTLPEGFRAWLDATLAASEEAGTAQVGSISDDFLRAELGGNRGAESTIGNFLGNVSLYQANLTQQADIGVMNPGGIRADFVYDPDGVVTYKDAATVLPFGNTVGTVDLTGEQFVRLLQQQWQPEGSSRPFLKLGLSDNVSYTFDPVAKSITDVYVDGALIDPAATYTVASNNFLLEGGDNFTVFTEGTNHVDTGMIDVDGLIAFFEAQTEAVAPDYTQYSVGVHDNNGLLGSDTITPGTTFDVDLSSLAFTNDEPKPANVVVTVGGAEVGSFPIDSTPVAGLDTTGQAKVTFTVPELTAGETVEVAFFLDSVDGQKLLARSYTATASQVFTDVPPSHPFFDEITWMAENGIANGWPRPDGTAYYGANLNIQRDAVAAFIFRYAALQDPSINEFAAPARSPFRDVPTTHPFYREISWMAAAGISTGWKHPDGTASFGPDLLVQRDALAAFLFRYAKTVDPTIGAYVAPSRSPFIDVTNSHVFYREIAWMAESGVSTGWIGDDGRKFFGWDWNAKRDAMAAFMFRLDGLLNG